VRSQTASAIRDGTAYQRGVEGEQRARALLESKQYRILAERYRNEAGEIDLVAERDGRLIFVEVKRRKSLDDAAWSVDRRQQHRIARAAEGFLAANLTLVYHTASFDVILVSPSEGCAHIEDAFSA
jgi:putative endonuclease